MNINYTYSKISYYSQDSYESLSNSSIKNAIIRLIKYKGIDPILYGKLTLGDVGFFVDKDGNCTDGKISDYLIYSNGISSIKERKRLNTRLRSLCKESRILKG
ncbi:MAG: hypothetical protein IKR19_08720 [Acholeplasmatales bacterium]|nr:hypothetical protein [Acholeplasmatales bacterium]